MVESAKPYHRGDLDRTLKDAAVGLITELGPAGFSLREVARRAGVSHAAPAHHFGDSRGLLTAIAIEAFETLDAAICAAVDGCSDPREQLILMARTYVHTGMTYPAHAAIVFRTDLVDGDDPRYQHAGLCAYGHLEAVLSRVRDLTNPDLDVVNATRLVWSAMQGLVTLYPNMQRMSVATGEELADAEALATQFAMLLLTGLDR
jgi:hypothetical protein